METEETDSPLISIGGSVSPEPQVEGFFDNSFYTKNSTSSLSSSSSGESSNEEQEQIEVKQEQFEQVEPQQQVDNELLNIKPPHEDQIVEMIESDLVEQNDLVLNDDDIIMQDEPVFADDDGYDEGFDFDEPDDYYYNEEEVEEQVFEQDTAIDGPDEYYEEEEEQVVEQDTTIDEPDEYYYEEEEQIAEPDEPDEPDEPPADESYYNLETFTLNVTKEDRAKRNETLKKHKLFFTEEEYNRYTLYKPDIHDENQKLLDKLSAALATLRKRRILNKKRDLAVEEEETPMIIKKPKIEPQVEQKPIQQKRTLLLQKPFSPYEQKPTILDTVLINMLRYNKQQASTTTTTTTKTTAAAPEPSDLEIAAMAAGILPDPSNTTPQVRRSRYNKDQHVQFLRISNELKSGSTTIPQSDIELYKSMCPGLKIEQDEFVKEQRKKVLNSGVYDTLDKKVEKMVEEFYAIEHTRLLKYPQFYKYFNLLNMPPQNIAIADPPILSFKKSLLQTGQIAACKPSMLESPRRLDLFKKYLYKPSKIKEEEIDIEEHDDDEDDGDKYYKKKLPPTVSTDKNITNLLQTNKADIVISSDTMVSFVELIHDISSDICIPITVVEKDNVRTLIFDRQLPKEAMTARERNKMIYDLTFKSLCLNWTKRHNITNASAIETISSGEETGNAKVYDDDWDSEKDENLQYNIWSFGDMNILIRHQADGEIIDNASKKPGSKERRVCLTSKLDYQISNGLEEIIMPTDRAANWLRSYIGGHALVLEGRIDVINNRLIRVDRKEMVDIMGAQWKPMQESELLRHTFSKLLKILLSGKYLLVHKKDDRNFLIYQTTTENEKSYDIDLHKKFSALKKPILVNKPDKTYIPAWSSIENQVPWTFPPK